VGLFLQVVFTVWTFFYWSMFIRTGLLWHTAMSIPVEALPFWRRRDVTGLFYMSLWVSFIRLFLCIPVSFGILPSRSAWKNAFWRTKSVMGIFGRSLLYVSFTYHGLFWDIAESICINALSSDAHGLWWVFFIGLFYTSLLYITVSFETMPRRSALIHCLLTHKVCDR